MAEEAPKVDELKHGSKMIRLHIGFFTDKVPSKDKKVAWEIGTVYLKANPSRDIKPDLIQFHHVDEVSSAIKELLKRNGIKLVANNYKFVE